jgi:hypothetical protein
VGSTFKIWTIGIVAALVVGQAHAQSARKNVLPGVTIDASVECDRFGCPLPGIDNQWVRYQVYVLNKAESAGSPDRYRTRQALSPNTNEVFCGWHYHPELRGDARNYVWEVYQEDGTWFLHGSTPRDRAHYGRLYVVVTARFVDKQGIPKEGVDCTSNEYSMRPHKGGEGQDEITPRPRGPRYCVDRYGRQYECHRPLPPGQ